MQKMIATSLLKIYAGKKLAPGEEFEAEENDVHVLTVGAFAKLKSMSAEKPNEYLTRDMGTLHAKRKYTRKAA